MFDDGKPSSNPFLFFPSFSPGENKRTAPDEASVLVSSSSIFSCSSSRPRNRYARVSLHRYMQEDLRGSEAKGNSIARDKVASKRDEKGVQLIPRSSLEYFSKIPLCCYLCINAVDRFAKDYGATIASRGNDCYPGDISDCRILQLFALDSSLLSKNVIPANLPELFVVVPQLIAVHEVSWLLVC